MCERERIVRRLFRRYFQRCVTGCSSLAEARWRVTSGSEKNIKLNSGQLFVYLSVVTSDVMYPVGHAFYVYIPVAVLYSRHTWWMARQRRERVKRLNDHHFSPRRPWRDFMTLLISWKTIFRTSGADLSENYGIHEEG